MLNVDRNMGAKQQVFIHHIAAHMVNGGPLSPAEKRLAELIVPDWGLAVRLLFGGAHLHLSGVFRGAKW